MDSRDAPKDSPAVIAETPYPQQGAPNGRDLRGGAEGLFKGLITAHAMLKHYLFALSSIMILSGPAWSAPVAPPSWFGSPTLLGTVSGVPMFNYEIVGAPVTLGIWSGYNSGSSNLSYLLTVDASFVGSQVSWDGHTWEISSVQSIRLSTLNAYPWNAPDSTYTGSVYIGFAAQTGIRPNPYGPIPLSHSFHVSAGDYLGEMVNGSLFVESSPESDLLQWNLSNDTNGVLTHEIVIKDESGVVVGGGVYTLNPGDANTYQVDLPEGFTIDEETRWAINPNVDGVPVDVAPPTPSAPVVIGSGSQTGQTGVSPVVFREGQTPDPTDTPNYPTAPPTDYTDALTQIRDTSRMGSDRIVSAVDSLRSELARKDLSVSVSGGSGGSSSAGASGVDPDVSGQLNSNLAAAEAEKASLTSEIEDAFGAPSAVRGVEEESVSGFESEWPELEFPWIGGTTRKFSTNPYEIPNIGPKLQIAAPYVNRFITFILCLSTFIYCFHYSGEVVASEAESKSETTWMDMVPKVNWVASFLQFGAVKSVYLAFVTFWIGSLTIKNIEGTGGDVGIMSFISSASSPAKVPHFGVVFDFFADFIPVATCVGLGLFTLFYMVTYIVHVHIFKNVTALFQKAA